MYDVEGLDQPIGLQKPSCKVVAVASIPAPDTCPITRIRMCPNRTNLAIGTVRGTLHIAQLSMIQQHAEKRLTFKHRIKDHQLHEAEVIVMLTLCI